MEQLTDGITGQEYNWANGTTGQWNNWPVEQHTNKPIKQLAKGIAGP